MKYLNVIASSLCVAAALFLGSCLETPESFNVIDQLDKEIAAIDAHLESIGETDVIEDASGIRIVIHELGNRLPALQTDSISIVYTGTLLSDGSKFDEGTEVFYLGNLIQGWKIAFSKIPQGSHVTLYIPSYYGYGTRASNAIPANSTLVFDVRFKGIKRNQNYNAKLKMDTLEIDDYLEEKNITALTDTTGARYVVTTPGTGASPTWFSPLRLTYSFKLLTNDTKTLISLERSPSEGFASRTTDYLQGMTSLLMKMQEGAKVTAYLPSGIAFGPNGAVDSNNQTIIPSNAIVIVDMELKEVL